MNLLLLPGMHGTARLFDPLLEKLPGSFHSHTISYPVDKPLGYDELLPMVEDLASTLGEFVVVGESFSGPLALMLAAKRPAGLRGLILCVSFARCPFPLLKPLMANARGWMFRRRPRWLIDRWLLGRFYGTPLKAELHEAIREVSPDVLAARIRAIAAVDVTTELRDCPMPILYLQAANDWVVSSGSLKMIRSIRPDVRAVTITGPHMLLQAAPDESSKAIAAFCEEANRCSSE